MVQPLACPVGLHLAQLALCPGATQQRCLPHASPQWGPLECHVGGEYQQCPLWKDWPIGGLPTPELRLPGGLPGRTQWLSNAVITTLPESLPNGVTLLEGKSTFLQADLSQSATKEQEPRALSPGSGLSPTPAVSPTRAFPPKAEGQISMPMEVSELLPWAALDTSDLVLPLNLKDSAKPVGTSSQVSTPEDAEMDNPTLEEIQASLPPWLKPQGLAGKLPLWMWPDSRGRPTRPWATCWQPGLPSMHDGGSRSLTFWWPSVKMSQRPLKLSKKWRPSVLAPSGTQRPAG